MDIAWPEKFVGFLLLIEVLLILLVGITSPTAGNPEWFAAGAAIFIRVPLITLLPVWIVLRAIDALFAGPARRRGAVIVRLH
jgi:hypothetical protein